MLDADGEGAGAGASAGEGSGSGASAEEEGAGAAGSTGAGAGGVEGSAGGAVLRPSVLFAAGALSPKRSANLLGPVGSGAAAAPRDEALLRAPPRESDGGISPDLRVARAGVSFDGAAELLAGFGAGAGRAARRFLASGSSIERPSASICSARAARSASARAAGSMVTCTKPRTGTMPALSRGAPMDSSAGRSPKATRRTPWRVVSTKGSSSVPAICWDPSAV